MRTTFDIDAPVLEALRRLSEEENKPMTRLASELLSEALHRRGQKRTGRPTLRWKSGAMHAQVNLEDKEAVRRALDEAP